MKLLKTIREKDIFPGTDRRGIKYRLRKAGRAVIFHKDKKIALLHVRRNNYYKLPGGGIERSETLLRGLQREGQEEAGCQIEIQKEIGRILEYRDRLRLRQESFCYLAKVVGEKGKSHFEPSEIKEGFSLLWVKPEKAIRLIKGSRPKTYDGKFIVIRDLKFVIQAKKLFPSRF